MTCSQDQESVSSCQNTHIPASSSARDIFSNNGDICTPSTNHRMRFKLSFISLKKIYLVQSRN